MSFSSDLPLSRQMAGSSMLLQREQPKGFESWRLACEAITGLSRYPVKPGQPSQPRRILLHSALETKDVGQSKDELSELQDMLDDYVETDHEKKMHGVVEQWKNELVRTSPMIRFMAKHLSIVGCSPYNETISATSKLPPILITGCPPGLAGGFSPPQPGRPPSESGIVVCSNRIMSKKHLENTMAHEMIHWWDNCRFQVDWTNLRHHACTEIRAAALSGDCRWTSEIKRRQYAFRKQFQACARRRAILSVEANPNCPTRQAAEQAVDEVWESCFNDTRPFDEVY